MKLLEWLKAKYREFRNPYVTAVDAKIIANKTLNFHVYIVLSNGKMIKDVDNWGKEYTFFTLSSAQHHLEYVRKYLVDSQVPIKLGR